MAVPQDPKDKRPRDRRGNADPSPVAHLLDLIKQWEKIRDQIRQAKKELAELEDMAAPSHMTGGVESEIRRLERARRDQRFEIVGWVDEHPSLRDDAIQAGFPSRLLSGGTQSDDADHQPSEGDRFGGGGGGEEDEGPSEGDRYGGGGGQGKGSGGSGSTTGGGGGGGGAGRGKPPSLRGMAADNRLLGEAGKDFKVVRGPGGTYVAVYAIKVQGQVFKIGVTLAKDPDKLKRYGIKPEDAKSLTRAQMKQIQNIGWADELAPHIRKGDKHILKSLERYLANQYGGNPMLKNDDVMAVVIANSMLGWSAGEFENQLRNTRWYKNTNEYQRAWATTVSPKQKRDTIRNVTENLIDTLENQYGFEWAKHVSMADVKKWATKIAEGSWGTPDQGLVFWGERLEDRAAKIEGTPAWMTREAEGEALRAFANRPEDKRELLRSQASDFLGPKYRPDDATLMAWATDIVSEQKTDADFAEFLRQQSKALHPWKDENTSWTSFASSYRAIAEDVLGGTPIDWTDPLLTNLQGTGPDGKLLNQPLSAREFELRVRQDNRAWQPGTRLYEEGLGVVSQLEQMFRGVA